VLDLTHFVEATPRLDRPTIVAIDWVESPEGYVTDAYYLAGFKENVLQPLGDGNDPAILLRWFDHRQDARVHVDPVANPDERVVIVEAMFLHRDELAGAWDVSIFLDGPFQVSVWRMAERDGISPDPRTRATIDMSKDNGCTLRHASRVTAPPT
jgi:hypothetical protein